MNAPRKHSDALEAYGDMLTASSNRHVRLTTTLAVCAVLGVCAALLALTTYWTIEHHSATVNTSAASPAYTWQARSMHDCPRPGVSRPWTNGEAMLHACNEASSLSTETMPTASRQGLVEPIYN